jgi:hypothetical protein
MPNVQSKHAARHRDSEAFYFENWSESLAVSKGILTCELWRHQSGYEIFELDALAVGGDETGGVVCCTVHAENLTCPVMSKVVVKRVISTFDVYDDAMAMVAKCS